MDLHLKVHGMLCLYGIVKFYINIFLSLLNQRGWQEIREDAAEKIIHTLFLFLPSRACSTVLSSLLSFLQHAPSRLHMMAQLLDLSLLKVEERRSVLLGRCSSLLERRRTGLGLSAGWSLLTQDRAAVRKTLWMLFSDVKAEHSR